MAVNMSIDCLKYISIVVFCDKHREFWLTLNKLFIMTGFLKSEVLSTVIINNSERRSSSDRVSQIRNCINCHYHCHYDYPNWSIYIVRWDIFQYEIPCLNYFSSLINRKGQGISNQKFYNVPEQNSSPIL